MIQIKTRAAIATLILSLQALVIFGQGASKLESVLLYNLENKPVRLAFKENRPVVFLILGTDCPISQKYIPTIESLNQSFQHSVEFIGIFPSQYSTSEVTDFVNEYKISFPCYVDRDMLVVETLEAGVTPEAFLLDTAFRVLYAGAVDNWFYKLGSYRTKVTKHYLSDAIKNYLAGNRISTERTEAIGCPIPQRQGEEARPASHSHH